MEEYSNNSVKKAKLQSMLTTLLEDPILADVPKKPTLADVDALINLELGSAMRISVLKLDGTSFGNALNCSFPSFHMSLCTLHCQFISLQKEWGN